MTRYLLLALALLYASVAQAFEAGAAKTEITPPPGVPLNGYGDRLGRSSVSIHDPLWSRCLYLDDGATRVFLVNTDLCLINRELRDRVLELAPRVVPTKNIILTATHTHNGPGGMIKGLLFRAVSGRFMPQLLEATAKKIANSMAAAYAARRRATIGYGTTEQNDLSVNRRQDGGPIDPQIGVIRVQEADGDPIAIIANFAAQPATVPEADHYAISADYPGYYYRALEGLYGGKCVAMFLNGAEGNQRCANPENQQGWARTESIGRLLATRVKAFANDIRCGNATLHVGSANPTLPRTLASDALPAKTVLKTLEINDLLLTFFPGEPCVEIGLEMRKRALARGYAAQFTVGLANDYLMYFVPRSTYSQNEYESDMDFYGPYIADWFYREFGKLMTKGSNASQTPTSDLTSSLTTETANGATILHITGSPRRTGRKLGVAFKNALNHEYQSRIVTAIESGPLAPRNGPWSWVPAFINPLPVALPQLAVSVRPMLNGVDNEVTRDIQGIAEGAGLPFDAVWLLQCLPALMDQPGNAHSAQRTSSTTFAALSGKKNADLLVGCNLDWADRGPIIVRDVRPERGHRFVEIGPVWSVGAYSGMNDAGLVLSAERVAPLGAPSLDTPPVEILLREILENAETSETALATLEAAPNLRGYHILVADSDRRQAHVIAFGATPQVRDLKNRLLLGAMPDGADVDPDSHARYARVATLLANAPALGLAQVEAVLRDADPVRAGQARIFNDETRYSVVYDVRARIVRIAVPTAAGELGPYTEISLSEKHDTKAAPTHNAGFGKNPVRKTTHDKSPQRAKRTRSKRR